MPDEPARDQLPIPDRPYDGPVYEDAKDPEATFPPIEPLGPPAGAPNVVIVLIDDAGFGSSSAFGGPCETPTAERLAAGGLKYNRFHTTALCSPTHAVTAEIGVPEGGANGVIVAQGGAFGGWSLYLQEGRPKYCYSFFGAMRFTVEAHDPVPAGEHQVRMEFAYDGGGLAKGGTATLYVDGGSVAEGRIEHTQPLIFSADETATSAGKRGRR